MPTIKQVTVYQFDELSDDAKEKAREWYRQGCFDYEWWDCVYEDAKRMAGILGITISNIYFSGFSSQGDGACFEGSYEYQKGAYAAIQKEAPKDNELHTIAKALQRAQRPYFYGLSATVKQSGHYMHENCTEIRVDCYDDYREVDSDDEEQIKDLLRDFMRWIYARLEAEHDYMLSDDSVDENIKCNEYTFLEDGSRD